MKGSRVNKNIKSDNLQDYDISFVVRDFEGFLEQSKTLFANKALKEYRGFKIDTSIKGSDSTYWLNLFGRALFIQEPESMSASPKP